MQVEARSGSLGGAFGQFAQGTEQAQLLERFGPQILQRAASLGEPAAGDVVGLV